MDDVTISSCCIENYHNKLHKGKFLQHRKIISFYNVAWLHARKNTFKENLLTQQSVKAANILYTAKSLTKYSTIQKKHSNNKTPIHKTKSSQHPKNFNIQKHSISNQRNTIAPIKTTTHDRDSYERTTPEYRKND